MGDTETTPDMAYDDIDQRLTLIESHLINFQQRLDHMLTVVHQVRDGVRSVGERQDYLIEGVNELRSEGQKAKEVFDQFMQGGIGKMFASLTNPMPGLFRRNKVVEGNVNDG